jgi:hypothetical protein
VLGKLLKERMINMANICSFSMVVVGKKENIDLFMDMMNQRGTTWMGRGAEASIDNIEEYKGKHRAELSGWCKWAVEAAMVSNAISMRREPERWSGHGYDRDGNKLRFVTLYEACKELDLDMEVYSEEPGCEFQEHYLFVDGELEVSETEHYEEEYNEETGDYESIGGFGDWDFEI